MASKSCNHCVAPLLIRLALATIFIWAGAIKIFSTMPVKGADAAALANMEVLKPVAAAPTPNPAPPPATTPPKDAKPSGSSAAPPATPPETPKTHTRKPAPSEPLPPAKRTRASVPPALVRTVALQSKTYFADDFPDEVNVRGVYGLALMLKKDAATTDAEGNPVKPIWPAMLGRDRWPVYMAWTCALTELIGGIFVLVGFITRLSSFGLAFVMGTALWLTQIGPAMASGHTRLGFLPDHVWSDGMAWSKFQEQVFLMLVALALVALGAGSMSVDRIVFPPPTPVLPRPKPEVVPEK